MNRLVYLILDKSRRLHQERPSNKIAVISPCPSFSHSPHPYGPFAERSSSTLARRRVSRNQNSRQAPRNLGQLGPGESRKLPSSYSSAFSRRSQEVISLNFLYPPFLAADPLIAHSCQFLNPEFPHVFNLSIPLSPSQSPTFLTKLPRLLFATALHEFPIDR